MPSAIKHIGRCSTHSAVCAFCDHRILLFPHANVLRKHGLNYSCPGNYTDSHSDPQPIVRHKPAHASLTHSKKQPGRRLGWRKRWQQKTGVVPGQMKT